MVFLYKRKNKMTQKKTQMTFEEITKDIIESDLSEKIKQHLCYLLKQDACIPEYYLINIGKSSLSHQSRIFLFDAVANNYYKFTS
jgi:hypothetical protein